MARCSGTSGSMVECVPARSRILQKAMSVEQPRDAALELSAASDAIEAARLRRKRKARLLEEQKKLARLFPLPAVKFTAKERKAIEARQQVMLALGPSGAAPVECNSSCPVRSSCELVKFGKAPDGQPCPFEVQFVLDRFSSWLEELDRTFDEMTASERAQVSSLVWLDLQERRCLQALARIEGGAMVQTVIRQANPKTGEPLAWEVAIHPLAERLDQIMERRRNILRDLELTREMRTKRERALAQIRGKSHAAGPNLAEIQSKVWEVIRKQRPAAGNED